MRRRNVLNNGCEICLFVCLFVCLDLGSLEDFISFHII